MSSPAQRVRGVGALVALLALVAGVPVALLAWVGNPMPDSAPSLAWIEEPLSSEALIGILSVVMWCAWAHFVVCVVREILAQRRAHGARPAAPGGHPLARRLVASALLMAGAVTVTAQSAQAVEHASVQGTTSSVVSGAVAQARAAGDAAQAAAEHATAEKALARQQRVDAAVAHGKDVGVSHEMDLRYRVKPPHARHHDSLWDIAERTLGDGRRWSDLYELNKDRVQADGSSLQDADLIYPGWELVMPDDARGASIRGLPEDGAAGNGAPSSAETPGADGATAGQQAPAAQDAAAQGVFNAARERDGLGVEIAFVGGLVAAGLLLGLRRRRGWDGGPPRGRGTTVDDEQALQLEADGPASTMAERGLRRLGSHFAHPPATAPVLQSVRVGSGGFTATFDVVPEQQPPEGWRILGDGRVWHAPADQLHELHQDDSSAVSAYPDVAVVGIDAGDHVLVNVGATSDPVTLGGDRADVEAVLRAITVDLATHAWGDHLTVLAVGVPDLDAGLAADRLISVGSGDDLGLAFARVPDAHPVTVVVGPGADSAAVGLALAARGDRSGRVTLLRAVDGTEADLVVDAHGRLTSRRFALFAEAARLSGSAAARLLELYHASPEDPAPLRAVPEAVIAPASAATELQLLGHVRARSSGSLELERAELVTEILTYLALHPAGVHTSVLAGAIWPRGVDHAVLDATMDRVRAFLEQPGPAQDTATDAAADPVLRCEEGRWSIDLGRVRVDWYVLRSLLEASDHARWPARCLEQALELVDGPPLSGLPQHKYGWLAASSSVGDMQRAIVECARRLGEDDDTGRAHWALRTGLRAVPSCEPLWQQLLRRTDRSGGPVASVADEMYATLARHGSPMGAEATTDALVHELLPAYVLPVRSRQLSA